MFEKYTDPGAQRSSPPRVRGVILAGAHTWDAQALDDVLPRCLLPVALSPLICYTLQWLRNAGVTETTICTDNVSRSARRALGDGSQFGMGLDYFEDWVPRGPAGCVCDAATGTNADAYVVVQSSVIPSFPLRDLLKTHFEARATLTVVLSAAQDENGGDDSLCPVGIYVFDRRALEYIPDISYQDIKEILLPKLRDNHEPVIPFVTRQCVSRVSSVESYLSANERMVELACRRSDSVSYRRVGESLVHNTASVCNGANLIGPVLVGPGVHVAPGASVVGPMAIGADSRINNRALVCQSVIWEDCEVGEGSHVLRSVLPGGSVVRAGARVRHRLLAVEPRPARAWASALERPRGVGASPPANDDVCEDCSCSAASRCPIELQRSARGKAD